MLRHAISKSMLGVLMVTIIAMSSTTLAQVSRCTRYVPIGAQCGGLYFCWDRLTMCRPTLAPWTDTCCANGAKCIRRTSTEWRCTRPVAPVPAPKPKPPAPTPPPKPKPSAPTPAPVPIPAPNVPSTTFASTMTTLHNRYRVRHQVDPLVWDATLANDAQRWANGCVFMHDLSQRGGENLYMAYYIQTPVSAATDASNLWYNEISQYNYQLGMFSYSTGHATCMLWKGLTRFGCAYQYCSAPSRTLVVCRYAPVCNVMGQFTQNVFPPK